jgi:hypothetical protein
MRTAEECLRMSHDNCVLQGRIALSSLIDNKWLLMNSPLVPWCHLDANTPTKQSEAVAWCIESLSSRERLTQRFPTSSKRTDLSESCDWVRANLNNDRAGTRDLFVQAVKKCLPSKGFPNMTSKPFFPCQRRMVTCQKAQGKFQHPGKVEASQASPVLVHQVQSHSFLVFCVGCVCHPRFFSSSHFIIFC